MQPQTPNLKRGYCTINPQVVNMPLPQKVCNNPLPQKVNNYYPHHNKRPIVHPTPKRANNPQRANNHKRDKQPPQL